MILERIRIPAELVIRGPVLTAGETFSGWGLDTTFYRNWEGKLAIPQSLVRGKLLEALKELLPAGVFSMLDIETLFGRKSGDTPGNIGSYEPDRGRLKITDFIALESAGTNKPRTRIRIGSERRTVEKGALMVSESPFPAGERTRWKGELEFFATTHEKAKWQDMIKAGLCFITCLGAEKTIGFGILEKVELGEALTIAPVLDTTPPDDADNILMAISPSEPILIGGVRAADNIFISETIIPGGVIKGAFAAGMNRMAGAEKDSSPILADHPLKERFKNIVAHFSEIGFRHAPPSEDKYRRPETIPLSGVSYGKNYSEIHFKDEEAIYADGAVPVAFQIDWKDCPDNLYDKYKIPKLEYHSVTRTAIDSESRRADDSMLYSFRMVKPETEGNKQIFWNTVIDLPKNLSKDDRSDLILELWEALPLALCYIGKRQSRINIHLNSATPFSQPASVKTGDGFALALQTPALMLDPEQMVTIAGGAYDDHTQLAEFYQGYWREVLAEPDLKLVRHFASQELRGGYQGMRYNHAGYRPFYLTSAGSVFVFSYNEKAMDNAASLARNGLPFPDWAKQQGKEAWAINPFVAENGYGEVKLIIKESAS